MRYAIEDGSQLSSRWLPLVFPEEQYNVARLSDLWVNGLDALSDMLERRNCEQKAEALDRRIYELPVDDEKRRAQAALDLLVGWAKKEDWGLVLLFDNAVLKMFYGAEGLYNRARRIVQAPPPEVDQSQRAELAITLAMAIEKPGLRRALETEGIRSLMNCGTEGRQRLGSMLDLEGEDSSLKDMVERFQSLRELGEKIEQAKDELPPEFWKYLITAPAR